jgi:outer membrane protein assembly factor BamB
VGDAFGPGDGGVEVLDAATGNQLQYADLHSAATSSPAVIMSWLYVGAHDGNLYAFGRSDSSTPTPRTNTSALRAD